MVFNLDKAIAEESPTRQPFTFVFDGITYELPAEIDIRAVAAISNGRMDDGLRLLLNPEQWEAIQASPKLFSSSVLDKLFAAYAAHVNGTPMGESSASTGSSKSTGRPSKRTSSTTTKRASGK